MSINKSLKNAMLTGNGLVSWTNNAPTQYNDRQRQYFSPETRTFTQQMAQYASDFVEAQVQGLDSENPIGWQTRLIRMADVVRPSAAILRKADSYKQILFADRDIEYVAPGSKIVTMGSTWLVTNPFNISGSDGKAIVQRCNAVWNYLDYYGNTVSEPIVVGNERENANDSDAQQSLLISKGYFNVLCQYNEFTRQIDTNTRLILGTGAYRVTGYADFETEFTGDYNSVRLLRFTVRYEEPNTVIDDMENHIAGGKAFSWDICVDGIASLRVGQTSQFLANSVRNGTPIENGYVIGNIFYAPPDWVVNSPTAATGTDWEVNDNVLQPEYPVGYLWKSSNESVATVDAEGNVSAVGEGEAVITATLMENPAYSASMAITVTESIDGVFFSSSVPESLSCGDVAEIEAVYVENGEETTEAVDWLFSGADASAYTAETYKNTVKITCYEYSAAPLIVTAQYQGFSASAEISLEGI